MEKKINFKVCGLSAKYFVVFFAIVMASVYLGFMPTVKIYSNDAGSYVATSFIMTIAFLMAVGGIFFWLGNTIPIVNNYLGGACLLPLLGASFLNFIGLVPQELVNGTKVLRPARVWIGKCFWGRQPGICRRFWAASSLPWGFVCWRD